MNTTTKDNGGPAFPVSNGQGFIPSSGMSLRDWFAGMALQGVLANHELLKIVDEQNTEASTKDAATHYAYAVADSMLNERSEP